MSSWYDKFGRLLGRKPARHLITDYQLGRDFQWLLGEEMWSWRDLDRKLRKSGAPLALTGGFAGLEFKPLSDALSAVNITASTHTAMFAGNTYCPIFSNAAMERGPVHFELFWSGTIAFGATLTTLTPELNLGTTVGTGNLGVGAATPNTATSGTGFLSASANLTIRGTGAGTNGRAYACGQLHGKVGTSGAGNTDVDQLFGYTALTFDSTAANGLWLAMNASATYGTITTQQLIFASWN